MTKVAQIQFGKQVCMVRMNKNMTQEKLSFESGLHRTYISSVERGERNISLINIIKIANALDVEVSVLFEKQFM